MQLIPCRFFYICNKIVSKMTIKYLINFPSFSRKFQILNSYALFYMSSHRK